MTISLQPGKSYNFSTVHASISPGSEVLNARYEGMVSYSAIKATGFDVDAKYRNYFPYLPPGSVNDPKNQMYYLFTASNGSLLRFCEQWIDLNSVVEVSTDSFSIHFQNADTATRNRVRSMLIAAGYSNFTVTD